MSCINVQTSRIGGVDLSANRVGGIQTLFKRIGGVTVAAERVGGVDSVSFKRNGGIDVFVGLVCDVQLGRYLRVTPTEVQWITFDTSVDYTVLSNTSWSVN